MRCCDEKEAADEDSGESVFGDVGESEGEDADTALPVGLFRDRGVCSRVRALRFRVRVRFIET